MKMIPRQKIWLTLIVGINLALWLFPSDVVEQIARDRHTMLGRYSRQHFNWNLGVLLFSIVSLYVDWSTGREYKRRWFQVCAVILFGAPLLGVVDLLMRSSETEHYIKTSLAYHHPPDAAYTAEYVDEPEAYRTYPNAPPGYGTVDRTLRTDANGFRNANLLDRYDLMAIGDSFAEGSGVSDEHAWPAKLAQRSGATVYNLGMSGYAPLNYLAALKEYALAFKPRVVLCMLYEGNDFRSAKSDLKVVEPSFSKRLQTHFKQSPLLNAMDRLIIETFAPLNCRGSVPGIEKMAWMPLAVPVGSHANHYAFAPKQLHDLYLTREEFAVDRHWLAPRKLLQQMHEQCRQAGCEFILVYAPTKAHVTLPLVWPGLPPGGVRDFTAISFKGELPAGPVFLANLLARIEAKETVVRDWCRREGIRFVSMTEALRAAAADGVQVYFTYDQHWTPEGHAVVADAIANVLAETPVATTTD